MSKVHRLPHVEVSDADVEYFRQRLAHALRHHPTYLKKCIEEDDMQVRANPEGKIGSCGCGRSPTGDCIGWHGLTETQLAEAKAKYQAENVKASTQNG